MTRRLWRIAAAVAVLLVTAVLLLRVADIPVADLRAKYTDSTSSFVTVEPGLSIHVRDTGRGVPVVLLHGSNASLQTWEPWVARFAGRSRVVTLDLPGHGLTGAHPRRDYSTAAMVAVIDAVTRARRLTRFVIGGNSMGGGLAAAYAVAHPKRVAGLILVDAAGAPYEGETDLPLGFRIAQTPVIRDIAKGITPRWLIASSLESTFSDPAKVTPAMVDRYWELLRYPGNRDATLDRFANAWTRLDTATLSRVKVPVLIIWGRDDRLIPVSSIDFFTRALPQSRVVILDRVGHVPAEEAPDASFAPVPAFMAQIGDTAPRTDAR